MAAAVAPLGTALTPEQILLLWKLHNEPVLCFDGDTAGQRAQMRALEGSTLDREVCPIRIIAKWKGPR